MCNNYVLMRAQEELRRVLGIEAAADHLGNLSTVEAFPDRLAPIARHGDGGLELVHARWGMPSPKSVLEKTDKHGVKTGELRPDRGITNVRNTESRYWVNWLTPPHRCLVPFDQFAEPKPGGNAWFAMKDDRPAFFAGIEVRGWKSVRKVKDGETQDDLFAFLTTTPNAEVAAIHPKAMPVILTEPHEWETWMSAPWEVAAKLQRPLPDGALVVK